MHRRYGAHLFTPFLCDYWLFRFPGGDRTAIVKYVSFRQFIDVFGHGKHGDAALLVVFLSFTLGLWADLRLLILSLGVDSLGS